MKNKNIAIVCNYELRPDRIGGMDRFFAAYDAFAKANNKAIRWYFSNYEPFEFYEDLDISSANGQNVEHFFLDSLSKSGDKFDILITHFTSLCSSFYKSARSIHDFEKVIVVDHNPRPLNGFAFKKRLKNRIKGLLYHEHIDYFVGVSNYTSRHIIKDLGPQVVHKTQSIHNGIDIKHIVQAAHNRSRSFSASDKLRLIVVSHLRQSKGIQDAIAALLHLKKEELSKVEVHVYGTGPMELELREMVKQSELQEVVHFKGSSSKIPEILTSFDYLLQPTYMECFSLSILESLAANVPVITTRVGGNPEVVMEGINGFLFDAKDVNGLANILKAILAGHKSITSTTRTLISNNYNLQKMVRDHFKLIEY